MDWCGWETQKRVAIHKSGSFCGRKTGSAAEWIRLRDEAAQQPSQNVVTEQQLPATAPQEDVAEANKAEEKAYLAKLKEDKSVKTNASGLRYRIVSRGKGRKPTAQDELYVKYKGYFVDGTIFDHKIDSPAIFHLRNLIPGMAEGLMMLGVGGKATLYIPAKIAYGEEGTTKIPPQKMLIFEVELIDIYNEFE